MTATLQQVSEIAREAHDGQVDKAGLPYIGHPYRIATKMSNDKERMVALLHDVLEDTDLTAEDLRAHQVAEDVIEAVVALTKVKDETLEQYWARVKANEMARTIKMADVEDNSDPARLAKLDEKTRARLTEKYQRAREALA